MRRGLVIGLIFALLVSVLDVRTALASCDAIPSPTNAFRGALGSLNRPYALPDDTGEMIDLKVDTAGCDEASPGFETDDDIPDHDQLLVTVLFEPPGPGAERHAVVLATEPNVPACAAKAAAAPAGLVVHCRGVSGGTLDLAVLDAETLRFRFPDTDAEIPPDGDDHTFTGPATLAVTRLAAPLPLALAGARCADVSGLVACVDELYALDASCATTAAERNPIFPHFTALPPANDFQALCEPDGQNECAGGGTGVSELRFTVDAAGNVLVPIDWRGILLRPDGIPLARLVRGEAVVERFGATGGLVASPGPSFLGSYSPGGTRLPPLFDPNPSLTAQDALALFGSADAPVSVIRVARRAADLSSGTPSYRACQCDEGGSCESAGTPPCVTSEDCPGGGLCTATTCRRPDRSDTGTPCLSDDDCTGANEECGPALFDLADGLEGGVGPILLARGAGVRLEAQNPVPLDGLVSSPETLALVELESVAGATAAEDAGGSLPQLSEDLNGDGDATDPVLVLRDRKSGEVREIGADDARGRAVTRIRRPPFRSAAVALEGELVAFLEPEPLQGDCRVPENCDHNGDGEVFDTILRAYRVISGCNADSEPCLEDLLPGQNLAVDAAPLVNGQSVVVSGGRVFFRVPEGANARQVVRNLGERYAASISGNGRYAAFVEDAPLEGSFRAYVQNLRDHSLLVLDSAGVDDFSWDGRHLLLGDGVWVHDRDSDGNGIFDEVDGVRSTRISESNSFDIAVSSNGRFICYKSPGIFSSPLLLHDRDPDSDGTFDEHTLTEPVSVDEHCRGVSNSGDTLVDSWEGGVRLRLFERETGDVVRLFANDLLGGRRSDLSYSGEIVSFSSNLNDLVAGDTNGSADVFTYDVAEGTVSRVSLSSTGKQLPAAGSFWAAFSDDGRFLTYDTTELDSVSGEPATSTWLTDLVTGLHRSLGDFLPLGGGVSAVGPHVAIWRTHVGPVNEILVFGPDRDDLAWDLDCDRDIEDTVLAVVDPQAPPEAACGVQGGARPFRVLGRAAEVAVAGGHAAFLARDGARPPWSPGRVSLWSGNGVEDLGLDASAIGLSERLVAALVPSPEGSYVEVYDRSADAPAWVALAPAASDFQVAGSAVAFRGAEDGRLYVYDADTGETHPTDLPATEFVLGERIAAFRVPERILGNLNEASGDADADDEVLHVVDLASHTVLNTRQAAVRCRLEACDPRLPYRVVGDSVTFLTLEQEQGGLDLDGDDDRVGAVVQTFHAQAALAALDGSRDAAAHELQTLGSSGEGVCNTTGKACTDRRDCCTDVQDCACFVPPGRCIEDLGSYCKPELVDCEESAFCLSTPGGDGSGTCHADRGECGWQADCAVPAVCRDDDEDRVRLSAPGEGGGQGVAFVSIECEADPCAPQLALRAAADGDGDAVLDPFDNCPHVANPDQDPSACRPRERVSGDATAVLRLRFDRDDRDRITLRVKHWQLPPGFSPAGATLRIDLGGSMLDATLDAKGKYKSMDGHDRVHLKQRRNGSWNLEVTRRKGDFAGALSDEGLLDESNRKPGKRVLVRLRLAVGDVLQELTVDLRYVSKAGQRGNATPQKALDLTAEVSDTAPSSSP